MAKFDRAELRTGVEDFRRFVNPLIAGRAAIAGEPVDIAGTEGGALVDDAGLHIEDFHGTQMLGHRRPEIAAAISAFLETSLPTWYPSRVSPLSGQLGRALHERTGYDTSVFGLSGADGVEAAIKLARALTGKPGILGLERAYHGCAMGSTALMAAGMFHDPFGPHLPGVRSIPVTVEALERELATGDVAAVIVEPIQGEGGVRVLPTEFVDALCALTEQHGALLVADEVQTGLGRTGHGFLRSSTWPRNPDAAIIAKGIGGGYVPLSALLTHSEIWARAYGEHFATGESHNITFAYNSIGMVAGLATLDLVTDEMIEGVARKGAAFKASLVEALGGHPLVKEVRGEGLLLGIELIQPDHPWLSFAHFGFGSLEDKPVISPLLCHRMYPHGFFCFTCGHDWSVFRLQPRFDIPEDTLARFISAMRTELDKLAEIAS